MRGIDWPMAQTSVLTTRETRLVDGTTELGEDQDVILDLGTCLPTRPASYGPMSGPSDQGGLVSSDRDSMIRNPAANVQTRSTAGLVCNWLPYRELQLVKLIRDSDPSLGLGANSRMYYEPSAPRRIPFYWTRIGGFISALCLSLIFILKESAEWLMGIVFGGCGKRSDFSCRGGDIEACPPFGAWESKETPLLYQPLRTHVVVVLHGEPDAGDNGNERELAVMIARGTNALDHSFVHAQCVVWGLLTRCGKKANWIVLLSRWRFSLCIQGKKMDSQEGKSLEAASSGRADISRGDTHSSEPVSRSPRSYYVATNDHVSPALPYSLSYPRKRRPLPVCFPHENSRPFVQLSSCPPTFGQGSSVPDSLQRSRNVSQSSNASSPTRNGMWCSYYPTSAYLYLSMMSCHRDCVANPAFAPPRSVWNFVSICVSIQKILSESCQLSCQRALNTNPGSYLYQFAAKLLQNFCFDFGCVEILSSLCWMIVISLAKYSSTSKYLLQQGVNFHGSFSAVLSVLQRSITLLLRFAWSPNLPNYRELRLRRLFSSIVYLSSIYEDCKYRVLQPFGSWDMFIILVMILILIGMLAWCTVSGESGPFRFTRSNVFKSNAFKQFQTAGARLTTPVQTML